MCVCVLFDGFDYTISRSEDIDDQCESDIVIFCFNVDLVRGVGNALTC